MNFEIINTRRNNKIYTNGIDTYKVFNENYDKRLVFLESFITTEVCLLYTSNLILKR